MGMLRDIEGRVSGQVIRPEFPARVPVVARSIGVKKRRDAGSLTADS